jgi:UDP-2-acetamido-3-amino-2,3-dideoxy-glucuronate N-acetyltransferase
VIGPFVEIQSGVSIGARSRIQSHSFICTGVHIGEDTFIGHGVMFTNDLFDSETIEEWTLKETFIGNRVRIGSNATILADIKIGDGVRVGAGAVVVRNVADGETVVGNPAYPVGSKSSQEVERTQTRSQ